MHAVSRWEPCYLLSNSLFPLCCLHCISVTGNHSILIHISTYCEIQGQRLALGYLCISSIYYQDTKHSSYKNICGMNQGRKQGGKEESRKKWRESKRRNKWKNMTENWGEYNSNERERRQYITLKQQNKEKWRECSRGKIFGCLGGPGWLSCKSMQLLISGLWVLASRLGAEIT